MDDATVEKLADVFESVLQSMETLGPGKLWNHLRFIIEDREVSADVDGVLQHIQEQVSVGDPNSRIHRVLARYIRGWDFATEPEWACGTSALTQERRARICERLGLDADAVKALAVSTPIAVPLNEAVLIAEEHQKWYTDERRRLSGSF